MNKWYVSIENKARGPYSDLQIRDKIKKGEFRQDTLAYREGDTDWRKLEEQNIWSASFVPQNEPLPRSAKQWVLLVESPLKKGDFQQQGPFTEDEVREKVDIGEVHLRDFCWKPGMANWCPLFKMPELGFPRKEKIEFVEAPTQVVEAKSFEKPQPSKKQSKIIYNDLPEWLEANEGSSSEDKLLPPLDLENPLKKIKRLPPLRDLAKERRRVFYFLCSVLVLFVMGFYLGDWGKNYIAKGIEKVSFALQKITTPPPPLASYVFIRELPLSRQRLLIKTDAKKDTAVKIKVYDSKGYAIKTKSNENTIKLNPDKLGEIFLDLSMFQIKKNQVVLVTASVGKLKARKSYTYPDESEAL